MAQSKSGIDWDYWCNLSTMTDMEAACLSLSINPSFVNELRFARSDNFSREIGGNLYLVSSSIFHKKLMEHLGNDDYESLFKRISLIENNKYVKVFHCGKKDVYLEKFVEWAIRAIKDIPEQLRSLVVTDGDPIINNAQKLSSEDWKVLAKRQATEYLKIVNKLTQEQASKLIEKYFIDMKITSAHGNGTIKASTILTEVLSGWFKDEKRGIQNT